MRNFIIFFLLIILFEEKEDKRVKRDLEYQKTIEKSVEITLRKYREKDVEQKVIAEEVQELVKKEMEDK